jgi:hypothetical protein
MDTIVRLIIEIIAAALGVPVDEGPPGTEARRDSLRAEKAFPLPNPVPEAPRTASTE